ncbi:class I SAM-dependent methyltransferase [Patescibacteria group bacterium]|nr:class I SAM-dependent methyltransferase [Patescibacteria group bacterium]
MTAFIIIIQLIYLLLAIILVIYLINIIFSFKKLVPYVPTPYKVIKQMIKLAEIKPADKIIDLGSGSGRIILKVACHYPNSVTGIDNSSVLILTTKFRFWLNKVFKKLKTKNYKIIKGNFLEFELSDYSLVFCFLTNTAMEKLKENFEQLPAGSRIISYHFHFASDKFSEKMIPLSKRGKIFIYQKLG